MRANAQLGKSHLPINIGRKARRKTSRASFPPGDAADGTTVDVKDVLEVLEVMHVMIPEPSEAQRVPSCPFGFELSNSTDLL